MVSEDFGLDVQVLVIAFVKGELVDLRGEHAIGEEGDWGALVLEGVVLIDLGDIEGVSLEVELLRQLGGQVVELGEVGCHY